VEVLSKSAQAKKMNNIRNRLDARRVLTDADFALIGKLKAAQAERLLDPRYRTKGALAHVAAKRKRQEEDDEEAAGANEFTVDPDSLAAGMRTGKTSKIERIMNVLEGRKDVRFEHEGHAGGLTNKEKLRLKNYVMVRKGKRSVSGKINKSNGDVRYSKMKAVRAHYFHYFLIAPHPNFTPCRKSNSAETRESAEERKEWCMMTVFLFVKRSDFIVFKQYIQNDFCDIENYQKIILFIAIQSSKTLQLTPRQAR
jgi:hypothetical protein